MLSEKGSGGSFRYFFPDFRTMNEPHRSRMHRYLFPVSAVHRWNLAESVPRAADAPLKTAGATTLRNVYPLDSHNRNIEYIIHKKFCMVKLSSRPNQISICVLCSFSTISNV